MASDQPKLGDIVVCQWKDIHADATLALTQEEINKKGSYLFSTYGLLVKDDRTCVDHVDPIVAVAAEVGEDGLFRGVTFIPVPVVISVKRVQANRRTGKKANRSPRVIGHDDVRMPLPSQR